MSDPKPFTTLAEWKLLETVQHDNQIQSFIQTFKIILIKVIDLLLTLFLNHLWNKNHEPCATYFIDTYRHTKYMETDTIFIQMYLQV